MAGDSRFTRQIIALKNKKTRDETGLFFVEGENFVKEIPDDWPVENFYFSESYLETGSLKPNGLKAPVYVVKDSVFRAMSDTMTPQGVMAVCRQKKRMAEDFVKDDAFVVIGERISDPGNLGSLIRTADAAGCHGVILTEGAADVYNPKVVRATAGSIFHIPVVTGMRLGDVHMMLKRNGIALIGAHVRGTRLLYDVDLRGGAAILIGNESSGLSGEALELCDFLVKIPMPGKAESLNASVASGVLLYEAVRQRMQSGI